MRVLIVDDQYENIMLLKNIISKNSEYEIETAYSGEEAFEKIEGGKKIDIVLLDIMMPDMDGFQVIKKLKNDTRYQDIPVIFIAALDDIENKIRAFEAGGVDYISKPFNKQELFARLKSQLKIKQMNEMLKEKTKLLESREMHLEKLVKEKTLQIENITIAMVSALESANLYNDDDTGNHIKRVSDFSVLFAKEYGMDMEFVKKIGIYSSLHDIGKVGTPPEILKKPGKLTDEEFEIMKNHVEIGYQMINSKEIDDIAKNIVRYHHEKYNGKGYLHGLKGEEIPLEARIVALADVYDALTTKRVYKEAFSEEKTYKIIKESKGEHFDPKLVEIYFDNKDKIIEVKSRI